MRRSHRSLTQAQLDDIEVYVLCEHTRNQPELEYVYLLRKERAELRGPLHTHSSNLKPHELFELSWRTDKILVRQEPDGRVFVSVTPQARKEHEERKARSYDYKHWQPSGHKYF